MNRIEDWIRSTIAFFFRLLHIPLRDSALESLVQFVKGEQKWDFCYSGDEVEVLYRMAETGKNKHI